MAYDPFSGGNSNSNYTNYNNKKNKKINISKYTKKLLPIIIIGIILFVIIKSIFFNTCIITLEVKNTEKQDISTLATISLTNINNNQKETFDVTQEIKVKKGKYNIKVRSNGYNQYSDDIELRDPTYNLENIVLEKNTKLEINAISFPKQVFTGQNVICQLELENKSPNETYDTNNIIFEGDSKDWEYKIIDNFGIELGNITILPKKQKTVLFEFRIPKNTKEGKYEIQPRIKYKKASSKIKSEFEIIKKPKINIKFNKLEGEYEIGKTNNYTITYEIDNSKNNININDFKFTLDINSIINPDVNTWFIMPQNKVLVEAKEKKTGTIQVYVPSNAKPETLNGRLIITSSSLDEPKISTIDIDIIEPDILFDIKLNKTQINLNYDINSNTTNQEIVKLGILNKNEFTINIETIDILDSSLIHDCNNFIYIPNTYARTISAKDSSQEVWLTISGNNTNYLQNLDLTLPENQSRICTIKVLYKHPFQENQTLEATQNLIINTN